MQASKQQMKNWHPVKDRVDFLRVQGSGQKWVSKSLILHAAPAAAASDGGRFGLTVSKKVSKSAVVRNRIRRRLRAAAYDVLPLCAKPGMDYVMTGRIETGARSYDDICQDLRWCLKRCGLSTATDSVS